MSDIHIYIEREQPVKVITLEPSGKRGPAGATGPAGPAGPNSVTSATTSDGTCDLSLNTLVVGGETLNTEITSNGTLRIENSTTGALSLMTSAAAAFTTSTGSSLIGVSSISISSIVDEETTSTAFMLPDRIQVQSDAGYISLLNTGNADFSGDVTVEGTLTADHIHGNLAGSVYAHVRAGETLAKGDPVYISGSHGSGANLIPIVSKADASNAAKMPAVGIMDAALANNANGHMVITGTITDLNTNAYTVNSVLYVASGGGFTATPPSTNSQPVAIVERANANNGAVIVKVNGLASSGGNGASDANKLVRFSSAGTIPVASIGGLGTGVATALAVNTGSAGAFVVNGGTATNMTLAGTAAFTSTTRPTSAGTGTPEATSLITRADGDARYGGPIYYAESSADQTVTNSTAMVSSNQGCTLTIPAGTYQVEALLFGTSDSTAGMRTQFTISPNAAGWAHEMFGTVNATVNANWNLSVTNLIGFRQTSNGTSWMHRVTARLVFGSETTITAQFSNFAASGNSVLKARSNISARKVG
jgi:hypothetical protein